MHHLPLQALMVLLGIHPLLLLIFLAEVDETTFQRPVTQWNVTKRKTSVFVDYVIKGDATNN